MTPRTTVSQYQLVGTGDYEGLSAVLFETDVVADADPIWSGVIVPGELSPER